MAVKYIIKYNDVEGVEHRCNISNDDFTGDATYISGYCDLKAGSVDDVDALFRGRGLELNLQADTSQTFSEFFTSNERTYQVEYKRDGVVRFRGWIEPEGYYESFITTTWFIKVNCLDGLSYLKNLSYVQSNGLIWTGKQSGLEIILNCLERTNLYLDVYTNIDIYYTGLSNSVDVLDNIYFNSERFYKDDAQGDNDGTIMSCEEVLKDVLQLFGASIIQWRGVWVIYKINQLFTSQIVNVHRYSWNGTVKGTATLINSRLVEIGSDINDFEIFHCNSNQSIGLEKATAIMRIYYKYGLLRTVNTNSDLAHNGVDIPGWTINDSSAINLVYGSGNVEVLDTFNIPPAIALTNTDGIVLSQGQSLAATFIIQSFDTPTPNSSLFRYAISYVPDDDPTETYWQTSSEGWSDEMEALGVWVNTYDYQTINVESSSLLSDGTAYIHILEAYNGSVIMDSIALTLGDKNTDQPEGEAWTFENEDITSSKAKENIEVFNGDNEDEFYIGTIYKNDQNTKTSTWTRKNGSEDLPIIHLLGDDLMRLRQDNQLIFTGDVKGYVDYFSILDIDGFDGLFSIIEYNYDSRQDITSLKLKRFYGDAITNLDVEKTLDYGNTVKPTIKG